MTNIERLRQYLAKASFSSSSDKHSALACLDEIEREQVSHVVVTNNGGQYQAKGFPSLEDALYWQGRLITEVGDHHSNVAKVD